MSSNAIKINDLEDQYSAINPNDIDLNKFCLVNMENLDSDPSLGPIRAETLKKNFFK